MRKGKILEGRKMVREAFERMGLPKKSAEQVENLLFVMALGGFVKSKLDLDFPVLKAKNNRKSSGKNADYSRKQAD